MCPWRSKRYIAQLYPSLTWGALGVSPSLVLPCNEVAWEEPLPRLSSFWQGLGVGGPQGLQNLREKWMDSPVMRKELDYQKGLGVLLNGCNTAEQEYINNKQ